MRIVKLVIALVFVTGFFLTTYLFLELRAPSTDPQKIIFEVDSGPFHNVIEKLAADGFIRNKKAFRIYAKITGAGQKIKIGEFEISKNMSAGEILIMFMTGKNYQRTFTIQEGLNIFEIAENLESKGITTKKAFLDYVRNPTVVKKLIGLQAPSLEGYLYPDTYNYTKNIRLEKLVSVMIEHFTNVVQEVAPQLNQDKKLRHQIIILASMIEKETGAPEERPIISSVFYNRLKKNMRLQSDPTIIYGKAVLTGVMSKNITRSDLYTKTAYNTYTISGLPAGPICNPGREAITAALKPDKTEYLYFVSMNEGRHYFSRTYEEHSKAVGKYQLSAKAREGKSWRHLKKTNELTPSGDTKN